MVRTFEDASGLVNTVAFHPDGTCLASGSTDSSLKLWDLRSNLLLQHYRAHTGPVTHLCVHPTGNFILSSSLDTTLKVGLGRGEPAGSLQARGCQEG